MLKVIKFLIPVLMVGLFFACSSEQKISAIKGMPEGAPVEKIRVVGQNCIWSPNSIKIHEGTHVIMEIESMDIPYQCKMHEYGLNFEVPAGQKVTAEFYAPDSDTLEFGCNIERNFHYQWGGVAGKLTMG